MEQVIERLEGIRQALVALGKAGKSLPSSEKGYEREVFVREFLRRIFPYLHFGHGAITDFHGNRSGQVEIVIVKPSYPSFSTLSNGTRLYIADGVVAILEVKSNVSAQWHQVKRTVSQVNQLSLDSASNIPVFAVGYTGYKRVENVKRRLATTEKSKCPEGILVLDSGIFAYPRREDIEHTGPWALWGLIAWIQEQHFYTPIFRNLFDVKPNISESPYPREI